MFGLPHAVSVVIWSIVIGAISGWLAGMIMKKKGSLLRNILLGFAGSIVGGVIFGLVGLGGTNIIGDIIISVVGACIVIAVANMILK